MDNYQKINQQKLQQMNKLMHVKNSKPNGNFKLDGLHKQLIALPSYHGLRDTHLINHFQKKGICENMIKTGVIDENGEIKAVKKKSKSVINNYQKKNNYDDIEQLEKYYQNQIMQEQKKQEMKNYTRGINRLDNTDQLLIEMENMTLPKKVQELQKLKNSQKSINPSRSVRSVSKMNKSPAKLTKNDFDDFIQKQKQKQNIDKS